MAPRWRIYYADQTTADDCAGSLPARRRGVIAIVSTDSTGLCVAKDADFYLLHREGHWTGHSLAGLLHVIEDDLPDIACVCFGICVADRLYAAIVARAISDSDFPRAAK